MRFLKDLNDGDRVADIYMCKQRTSAVTKNGKNYLSVILQDKTGTMDAKVWDPSSPGIADFDAMDYIEVMGDVSMFNGSLQMSIKRLGNLVSSIASIRRTFSFWTIHVVISHTDVHGVIGFRP